MIVMCVCVCAHAVKNVSDVCVVELAVVGSDVCGGCCMSCGV